MNQATLRVLLPDDAAALARMLTASSAEYRRYFHPFAFEEGVIRGHLARAIRDVFFGVDVARNGLSELAGFYMLRGWDEGYADAMYGVFIGQAFRGMGLARLTLAHAECVCRLNDCRTLMLKVHPDNARARKLYELLGFKFVREEAANNNLVMGKDM